MAARGPKVRQPAFRVAAILASLVVAAVVTVIVVVIVVERPAGHTLDPDAEAEAPSTYGSRASCPGADHCPYRSLTTVGRPGEGVLRYPEALAIAPDGDVYVADQFSYLVQRFSASGKFLGQWGSYGDGPGQFGAVGGLAVSPSGDVYVVDATHDRVERFGPEGRFLGAWGSAGKALGQFDFGGGGGPGAPPGGGIAVGGGYVYVSDTLNDRIERFTLSGSDPVAWGEPGRGDGQLRGPRGLAVHGDRVYVADDDNARIEVFSSDGRYLAQTGSFGHGPGQFANPYDVAVATDGTIYVADDNNHRIDQLTSSLSYVSAWSLPGNDPEHEAGAGYPRAVATNAQGDVYVANAAEGKILRFTADGGSLGSFGLSGRWFGQFMNPFDVAVSSSGEVMVADTDGRRIEIFNSDLHYRGESGGGGITIGAHFLDPTGVAFAGTTVWVANSDNNLLLHLKATGEGLSGGGFLGALSPGGIIGSKGQFLTPSSSSSSSSRSSIDGPIAVAVGPEHDIYVTDSPDQLQRFTPTGNLIETWGGPGAHGAHFTSPLAIALNGHGDVYVADTDTNRIVELSPRGALIGQWGNRGPALARVDRPDGLAVDSRGDVFVADAGSDRIQEFTADGHLLTAWGAPGRGPGELSVPGGIALDCQGDLFVADNMNNRIQKFVGVASPSRCTRRVDL